MIVWLEGDGRETFACLMETPSGRYTAWGSEGNKGSTLMGDVLCPCCSPRRYLLRVQGEQDMGQGEGSSLLKQVLIAHLVGEWTKHHHCGREWP